MICEDKKNIQFIFNLLLTDEEMSTKYDPIFLLKNKYKKLTIRFNKLFK